MNTEYWLNITEARVGGRNKVPGGKPVSAKNGISKFKKIS